jgi:nucleoside-triphosphatase
LKSLFRLLFLTGPSGIGKTSILLRTIDSLNAKGLKTGGMISREVREKGIRVGFEIVDIKTGQKGWLAHINQPTGPQISKYRVNMNDLNRIGVAAIKKAVEEADVIVVDEIGPMELFSTKFKEAIIKSMKSEKQILGTIHARSRDPFIIKIKTHEEANIIEVTMENRNKLHTILAERILSQEKSQTPITK